MHRIGNEYEIELTSVHNENHERDLFLNDECLRRKKQKKDLIELMIQTLFAIF